MTDRHLIIGAGPVGRHVAQLLADPRLGGRRRAPGRAPTPASPACTHLRLDASDADALTRRRRGRLGALQLRQPRRLHDVGGRSGRRWPQSILAAAERTGAVYAITGNLYPYGPVDGPMHRGHARRRDRPQGRPPGPRCGPTPRPPTTPAASAPSRCAAPTTWAAASATTATSPGSHAGRAGRARPSGHGDARPAALLDRRPRRGADADRGRRGRDGARTHLARADQRAAHQRPGAQRRARRRRQAGRQGQALSARDDAFARQGESVLFRELGETSYQRSAPYVLDSTAAARRFSAWRLRRGTRSAAAPQSSDQSSIGRP